VKAFRTISCQRCLRHTRVLSEWTTCARLIIRSSKITKNIDFWEFPPPLTHAFSGLVASELYGIRKAAAHATHFRLLKCSKTDSVSHHKVKSRLHFLQKTLSLVMLGMLVAMEVSYPRLLISLLQKVLYRTPASPIPLELAFTVSVSSPAPTPQFLMKSTHASLAQARCSAHMKK